MPLVRGHYPQLNATQVGLGFPGNSNQADVPIRSNIELPWQGGVMTDSGAVLTTQVMTVVPVPVEVGHGDAGFDGAERELAETVAPHARIVVDVGNREAGLGWRELMEELSVRSRRRPGGEGPLLDDGGGSGGGGSERYRQEHREETGRHAVMEFSPCRHW